MEPLISDLGLDRLLSLSRTSSKSSNSSLIFGSQRSTMTSAYDHHLTSSSPYMPAGPSGSSTSPYQAPESLRNLKPNPKWDVFSFGVVLLELFTGRVLTEPELGQCSSVGSISEERNRMLQLADVTIRADLARREEAVLACLKLGFNCASFAPQKRPSMKEALQILEKIPSSS